MGTQSSQIGSKGELAHAFADSAKDLGGRVAAGPGKRRQDIERVAALGAGLETSILVEFLCNVVSKETYQMQSKSYRKQGQSCP